MRCHFDGLSGTAAQRVHGADVTASNMHEQAANSDLLR